MIQQLSIHVFPFRFHLLFPGNSCTQSMLPYFTLRVYLLFDTVIGRRIYTRALLETPCERYLCVITMTSSRALQMT
jgi:hypothetical protein